MVWKGFLWHQVLKAVPIDLEPEQIQMCEYVNNVSLLFQIHLCWDLVTSPATKRRSDEPPNTMHLEARYGGLAWLYDFNDSPQALLDWVQTPELCNLWSHILQIVNIALHSRTSLANLLEALSNLAKIIIRDRAEFLQALVNFLWLSSNKIWNSEEVARSWQWLQIRWRAQFITRSGCFAAPSTPHMSLSRQSKRKMQKIM